MKTVILVDKHPLYIVSTKDQVEDAMSFVVGELCAEITSKSYACKIVNYNIFVHRPSPTTIMITSRNHNDLTARDVIEYEIEALEVDDFDEVMALDNMELKEA